MSRWDDSTTDQMIWFIDRLKKYGFAELSSSHSEAFGNEVVQLARDDLYVLVINDRSDIFVEVKIPGLSSNIFAHEALTICASIPEAAVSPTMLSKRFIEKFHEVIGCLRNRPSLATEVDALRKKRASSIF